MWCQLEGRGVRISPKRYDFKPFTQALNCAHNPTFVHFSFKFAPNSNLWNH